MNLPRCRACGNKHYGPCAEYFAANPVRVQNANVAHNVAHTPESVAHIPNDVAHTQDTVAHGVAHSQSERSKAYRERHGEGVKQKNRERMRVKRAKDIP